MKVIATGVHFGHAVEKSSKFNLNHTLLINFEVIEKRMCKQTIFRNVINEINGVVKTQLFQNKCPTYVVTLYLSFKTF